MAQSFGYVEDKLHEADFFLARLSESRCKSGEARFYFSAFVSAARSVAFAMQASLSDIPGFDKWYFQAKTRAKVDPLLQFFIDVRNDSIHEGINALNVVGHEHMRDSLARQLLSGERSHFLVVPTGDGGADFAIADAAAACTEYLRSLVQIVYDCYEQFKTVIDPQWHYTKETFAAMGKGFEDALAELGYPREWASAIPESHDTWRVLRSLQPPCGANDLFGKYIGKHVLGPDDFTPTAGE